jgi:hypothetical protein
MGNVIPIENSKDFLREKAPEVEIDVSLNIAYINILFPSLSVSATPIARVVMEILEYGSLPNGDIDLENLISSQLAGFNPGQTSYAEPSDDEPLHVVYKKINNNWYIFNFMYTYRPAVPDEGGNTFYSNQSSLLVDNNTPKIYPGLISPFMKGLFRDRLEEVKKITIWYSAENISPAIGDVIYQDIYQAQMVTRLSTEANAPYPYTIGPLDNSYRDATIFFRRNEDVLRTIGLFFEELPEDGEIPFIFEYNSSWYQVIIKGNLKKYLEDVEFVRTEAISWN